jgi:hypothetical protein
LYEGLYERLYNKVLSSLQARELRLALGREKGLQERGAAAAGAEAAAKEAAAAARDAAAAMELRLGLFARECPRPPGVFKRP